MSKALKWFDNKGRKFFIAVIVLITFFIIYFVRDDFNSTNLIDAVKWTLIFFAGGNIGEHIANRGNQ